MIRSKEPTKWVLWTHDMGITSPLFVVQACCQRSAKWFLRDYINLTQRRYFRANYPTLPFPRTPKIPSGNQLILPSWWPKPRERK